MFIDECEHNIPFDVYDKRTKWIPILTIPAAYNIFSPRRKILWHESQPLKKHNRSLECGISRMFVQTDNRWTAVDHTRRISITIFNGSSFIKWNGDENDAQELEGAIVQLKAFCVGVNETFCLSFRIAGVKTNTNTKVQNDARRLNRIELIVCFSLGILLIFTIVGSFVLWKFCWKIQRNKLYTNFQNQFLFYMKQQQMLANEQMIAMRVNMGKSPHKFLIEHSGTHSAIGLQKKKLFFSTEFFETDMMINPPLLAQNFLYELHKMINIARERIKSKRHVPKLSTIVENDEGSAGSHERQKAVQESDGNLQENAVVSLRNQTDHVNSSNESSPKSTKSGDSGRESLSEEDIQITEETEQLVSTFELASSHQKVDQWTVNGNIQPGNRLNTSKSLATNVLNGPENMLVNCNACTSTTSSISSPLVKASRIRKNPLYSNRFKQYVEKFENHIVHVKQTDAEASKKLPKKFSTRRTFNTTAELEYSSSNLSTLKPNVQSTLKSYALYPSTSTISKKSLPRRSKKLRPKLFETKLSNES